MGSSSARTSLHYTSIDGDEDGRLISFEMRLKMRRKKQKEWKMWGWLDRKGGEME